MQLDQADAFRTAVLRAFSVARETDLVRQQQLVSADIKALMDADIVQIYGIEDDGNLRLLPEQNGLGIPPAAQQMELELSARAVAEGISLISSHPLLHSDLTELACRCTAQDLVTHLLLVNVDGQTHGAFAAHWITRERPAGGRRTAFFYYWDLARFAIAASAERARIERQLAEVRRHAYYDKLTGLPSGLALEERLRDHDDTDVLSILSLDFDGMREANKAFGYEAGGDVLIRTVGDALGRLTHEPEFPARQHRGGDEFAVILPGADAEAAATRAQEIEGLLDSLVVPETHQHVYHGASVGHATRHPGENAGQTLGRAIEAMTDRKSARRRT
jgi:diguanylate cyclase (GGDEF)-like protein